MTRFNLASRLRPPQIGGTLSTLASLQIQKNFTLVPSSLAVTGVLSSSGNIQITAGGGSSRTWTQVTGNEGYRVIWGSSSQSTATGSIEAIQALYASSADTATNVNSYTIPGTGTKYWRVSVLVNGYPQEWSDEASFTA